MILSIQCLLFRNWKLITLFLRYILCFTPKLKRNCFSLNVPAQEVRNVGFCSLNRKGVLTWQMNPSLERRNKIWLAKIGMFLVPFICSFLSFVTGKSLYPTHLSSSILNPWNYASGSGIDCFSTKAFWRWINISKIQTSSRDKNSNLDLCCS